MVQAARPVVSRRKRRRGPEPVGGSAAHLPSTSRAIALEALERTGQSWRIVCTSSSCSGLNAAALAGLGVTVQADGVLPPGLTALPPYPALPELGHIEFVLAGPRHSLRGPAGALATAILDNAYRLW